MTDTRAHWDHTYLVKSDTEVSWYQQEPLRSLSLIKSAAQSRTESIIDIGGGTSRLVDGLLAVGFSDLTVLDISEIAIGRSIDRLAERAGKVSWIVADMTEWQPERIWDVWHDRAVFHFLTDEAAQTAYVTALTAATRAGSAIIVATFSLHGPERCSGLPVQRYSAQSLAMRLGSAFTLYAEEIEAHPTPFGTTQEFSYAAFRRR